MRFWSHYISYLWKNYILAHHTGLYQSSAESWVKVNVLTHIQTQFLCSTFWKWKNLKRKPDFVRQPECCKPVSTNNLHSNVSVACQCIKPSIREGWVPRKSNQARKGWPWAGSRDKTDLKFTSFWGSHTRLSTARRHLSLLGDLLPWIILWGNTYSVSS